MILPIGYRWLKPGELIQLGDKFYNQNWYHVYKHHYGHEVYKAFCLIRPIKNTKEKVK